MSDTAPVESTEAEASPTDLLDNLRELGTALPVSFQPNAHDAAPLLAGVIWYLATGSLEAPRVDVPDQAEANAELAELTRFNESQAKVAELERRLAAKDAGPSPVAPPPVATAPEPTAPVGDQGEQGDGAVQADQAGTLAGQAAPIVPGQQVDPAAAAPVPPGQPATPAAPPEGVGS